MPRLGLCGCWNTQIIQFSASRSYIPNSRRHGLLFIIPTCCLHISFTFRCVISFIIQMLSHHSRCIVHFPWTYYLRYYTIPLLKAGVSFLYPCYLIVPLIFAIGLLLALLCFALCCFRIKFSFSSISHQVNKKMSSVHTYPVIVWFLFVDKWNAFLYTVADSRKRYGYVYKI